MPWDFPILKMLGSIFSPPSIQGPDGEAGVPRPPFPPQIHPNDPGFEYEMHGTYANQLGNSFNVVYWPDFDCYSYHFASGAAQGHSAKRQWYATKDEAVAKIQAGQ